MAYTTTAAVRTESGFEGNTHVPDTMIDGYLEKAHAVVQGHLAAVYDITQFVSGSLFTDSQAEDYLQRAELLIASGFLLIKQYGGEVQDDVDSDGQERVDEGIEMLKMLADPEFPVRLIDINGDEFKRKTIKTAGKMVAGGANSGDNIFSVTDTY